MYPPSISATAPSSERTVWTALRNLSDPWRVFHNVEWVGDREGKRGDGEADFILFHPKRGLVVLEVKGGGIAVGGRAWFSFDRTGKRHEIADPFQQAKTSKYALLEYLKRKVPALSYLPAGHAVCFPDLANVQGLGANAPEEIALAKSDLSSIEEAVARVVSYWEMAGDIPDDVMESVTAALAPQMVARQTGQDQIAATSAQILYWTNEQLSVLDALARNRRQLVYGGAGTGKTVLAQEKARRLAAEGKTVLFTCFNAPLARKISENLAGLPEITVSTFHSLCKRLSRQASMVLKPGKTASAPRRAFPDNPSQEFWDEEAAELLVEAADYLGFHVDAIVVDEGQDFAPGWWDALELLLGEPGRGEFYLFADTHQAIYRKEDWRPPFEGPAFDLQKNCRNTLPIAERVAAIYGDTPSTLGAEGKAPEFIEVENVAGAVKSLKSLLHGLLNEENLTPGQVAILCQRRSDVESLLPLTLAGYALTGFDQWGEGVLVETIHRFKGLEADVCIVLLFDMSRPWDRALAYIGISRARAQLIVIGPASVNAALAWSN